MDNALCRLTGADFPLFAFSHCRDVVAAVSRAGGFGVLGASSFTPEQLETELAWIDANVGGRAYGVDVLLPEHNGVAASTSLAEMRSRISASHIEFIVDLLARHGVPIDPLDVVSNERPPMAPDVGERLMDVAFRHPIRLIVNALGIAPPSMIERAREHGVPVGALVGAKEHAVRQARAGVDIIVAQGAEAGGHCGEVSTLVLIPEVLRAIEPIRAVPVLAAGGIMTGRQMAGCMAMGAQGVWTGSVWLATSDSDVSPVIRDKIINATSRDTIRSRARTGKYSRQLRSSWHEAWDAADAPPPLPLPLMGMIAEPVMARLTAAAERGNDGARTLVSYFAGQGIGLVDGLSSATAIVQQFKQDFADAAEQLGAIAFT